MYHKSYKMGCIFSCMLVSALHGQVARKEIQEQKIYNQTVTHKVCLDQQDRPHCMHGTFGEKKLFSYPDADSVIISEPGHSKSILTKTSCHDFLTGLLCNSAGLMWRNEKSTHTKLCTQARDDVHIDKHTYSNSAGHPLLHRISANNSPVKNQIEFTYDLFGHLTQMSRGNSPSASEDYHYHHDEKGRMIRKILPDKSSIRYAYTPLGKLQRLWANDNTLDYRYVYNSTGQVIQIQDAQGAILFSRRRQGNTDIDTQANGIQTTIAHNEDHLPLIVDLGQLGSIHYTYEDKHITSISRYTPEGTLDYTHHYDEYDDAGRIVKERLIEDLGTINRRLNLKKKKVIEESPYHKDFVIFDEHHNVVQHNQEHYKYDGLSQMAGFDGLRNPKEAPVNALNQVTRYADTNCTYDKRGNLVLKRTKTDLIHFTYDPLNRLTVVNNGDTSLKFTYDPFGRRMTKRVYQEGDLIDEEYYIYQKMTEIASITSDGQLRALRIINPTDERAIAIELEDQTYVPVYDLQGNIKSLIDPTTKAVCAHFRVTPFGDSLKIECNRDIHIPWVYMCKRLDEETGLYYFEQRYYDPTIKRWITPDLYTERTAINQYCFLNNNPFMFKDPNGCIIQVGMYLGAVLVGTLTLIVILEVYACYQLTVNDDKEKFDKVQEALLPIIGIAGSLIALIYQAVAVDAASEGNTVPDIQFGITSSTFQ